MDASVKQETEFRVAKQVEHFLVTVNGQCGFYLHWAASQILVSLNASCTMDILMAGSVDPLAAASSNAERNSLWALADTKTWLGL